MQEVFWPEDIILEIVGLVVEDIDLANILDSYRQLSAALLVSRQWHTAITNCSRFWIHLLLQEYVQSVNEEKIGTRDVGSFERPSYHELFQSFVPFILEKFSDELIYDDIQRGDIAPIDAESKGHIIRKELPETERTISILGQKNLVYASVTESASSALRLWIEGEFGCVRRIRSILEKERLEAKGKNHYEFESTCPDFRPQCFWYELVSFCHVAVFGYLHFWQEFEGVRQIGLAGSDSLQTEYEYSLHGKLRPYAYSSDEYLTRVWNPTTLNAHMERSLAISESESNSADSSGPKWVVCSNAPCNIRFLEKNATRPIDNIPGAYCSAWCAYDDAYRGAEFKCASPNCKRYLKFKMALGLNWFHETHHTPCVHDPRAGSNMLHETYMRISRVLNTCRASIAKSALCIRPKNTDRPKHVEPKDWAERHAAYTWPKNPVTISQDHRHKVVPENMLGYMQPAQLDVMPRLVVGTSTSMLPVLFCSYNCKEDKSPTYCLNPLCPKVFETQFAAASFECLRVVYVTATGERFLRGYVCDWLCRTSYLLSRRQQIKNRKRKAPDTDRGPPKKCQKRK